MTKLVNPSELLTAATPEHREWMRREMERQRSWRRRQAAKRASAQSSAGRPEAAARAVDAR